jgi:hypothetical protein
VLVALPDALDRRLGDRCVVALVSNDHYLAVDELFAHLGRNRQPRQARSIGEIEVLIALDGRQTVLLDQLLDLRPARFRGRLLLLPAIELLIARILGGLRLGGGELFRGNLLRLVARPWPLPLGRRFGLLFGAQTRLQQLVAQ